MQYSNDVVDAEMEIQEALQLTAMEYDHSLTCRLMKMQWTEVGELDKSQGKGEGSSKTMTACEMVSLSTPIIYAT